MSDPVLDARQAALAAELRALYGYALVGPRVPAADRQLVRDCIAAHTALRDATVAALEAAGVTPVTPQPDYPELYPVDDPATARDRAVGLEQTCSGAWRFLYARLAAAGVGNGTANPAERTTAQHALSDSAVRATRWLRRAGSASPTVAFPGIT